MPPEGATSKSTKLSTARRKYLVGATLVFSLGELVVLSFMVWPSGFHTGRDLVGFLVLAVIAVAGGWLFSALSWNAIKGMVDR